jgi:hypothetical protein
MPLEVLYGLGTLILLIGLVYGVIRYRRSAAAREQDEVAKRSGRVAQDAARAQHR